MENDYEYLSKIESIMQRRRKKDPLQQEIDRLFTEMYPVEQFMKVHKLGIAHALATFKNHLTEHFCKDCNYVIDEVIKFNKEDKEINEFLIKLLK